MNIVDAVQDNAGLTDKQIAWKSAKELSHAQHKAMRMGMHKVVVDPTTRKHLPCTCSHTPKHHRLRGGCRKGCDCRAGVR